MDGNITQGACTCMKHIKRLICGLMAALMLMGAAAQASSAKVNSSSARFYKSSSTASNSVSLKKGTSVSVKSISGSWAKVSLKGVTGYVPVKYLNTASRRTVYTKKSTRVYKSASTSSSGVTVGVNTKLYVVGVSGNYLRVQNSSGTRSGYVSSSAVSSSKTKTASSSSSSKSKSSWKRKVVKKSWFNGGSSVLDTGRYGYIYAINSGITVRIKRMGGHNHADCEPATAADTAKLKKIAGGSFSWDCIPVILHSEGKYVACSINTMPHGDQTITNNNYNGQFCLHMVGSKTHGTEAVNESHQDAIDRAYNWAH